MISRPDPRLFSVLDAVSEPVFVHDFNDFSLVYVNRAMRELYKCGDEPIARLTPDRLLDVHSEFTLEEASRLLALARDEPQEFEWRARDLTGHSFWVLVKLDTAEIAGVRYVVALARDLTERREAAQQSRSERRFRETLLHNLPGMVYRCRNDPHWTMAFVSEGSLELTGYASDALEENRDLAYGDLIVEEHQQGVWDKVQRALHDRERFELTYRIRCADGSEKWVWERGEGVHAPTGELLFLEGFITDITQLRRLEAEVVKRQKLESLGILAGGLAHDFNNLLTSILGNINLAQLELAEDSALRDYLSNAQSASFQATGLTRQLLTFARGGAPVKRVRAVADVVREVSSFSVRGQSVSLVLDIEENPWPVECDGEQIGQVVSNLVINAQQANASSGVITVSVQNRQITDNGSDLKPGPFLCITVQDEGQGIAADVLPRIFDPFFTTKPTGTGLGLSVSHSIVRQHGGVLNVTSTVGVGTEFEILLPAAPESTPQASIREAPAVGGRGRILVMDDERLIRRLYTHMLTRLGYEPVAVADGSDAVDAVSQAVADGQPFDAVVLDATIPGGMGGLETLKRLHELWPDLPAILASGYSTEPRLHGYQGRGFSAFLRKPFSLARFAQALKGVLHGAPDQE